MWTEEHRIRAVDRAKAGETLPSDLTDAEWAVIEPLMPCQAGRGRRRVVDLREVIDAIRYLVRSGCEWRMLPHDFPPWQTVYWWFRRFVRRLLFRLIHDIALMLDRQRSGRAEQPTTGVLDSQSVKAPGASERGYDAGKKVVGRKRHIDDRAVDENHAGRQYGSCQDPWLYARAAWGVRRRCLDYAFVAWKYSG